MSSWGCTWLTALTIWRLDDYYDPHFHFCEPEGGPHKEPESLGSILFGDRIFNSPYDVSHSLSCYTYRCNTWQIHMLRENGTCKVLCRTQVPAEDAKFVNDRIKEDYALNWLVDGLPAAEAKVDVKTGDLFYDMGFNLGDDEGERVENPALNNHYEIVLRYVP